MHARLVRQVWRAPRGFRGEAAVPVGGVQARTGNTQTPRPIGGRREACGARPLRPWAAAGPGQTTSQRTELPISDPRPTGVEGAGGTGGPGCGGRGRWRGLAGLRADAPSAARGADGERAGRRPRTRTAARPDKSGPPAPGTPVGPQATPEIRRVRKRHPHNGQKETPTAPGTP